MSVFSTWNIPPKIVAVVEEKDQLEAELAKLNAQIAARQVEVEAAPSRAANAKKGGTGKIWRTMWDISLGLIMG